MNEFKRVLGGLEPWMVSSVAVGAATASFLVLLLPPFITSVTDSAARVGIVFAVVSLAAMVGPLVGRIAVRTEGYRSIYLGSMFVMSASFVLLAVGAHTWRWTPVFGLTMGASYAAVGTIGPAFIVGADQPQDVVAAQMTAFSIAYPVGQLLGAVIVAGAEAAGAGFEELFWIAAAVMLAMTLATWPALHRPTARLLAAEKDPDPPATTTGRADNDKRGPSSGPKAMIVSAFGAFLLTVVLSSVGNNGLTSQLANVMPNVYGFTASETSLLLGVAGLLNIGAIIYAGNQLARRGAFSVYRLGTIIRTVGALAMAIVGLASSPLLGLAAIAMLVTYQGVPMPRVVAPELAASLAPVTAAEADGYYFAASAVGAVVGCLLAGVLAEQFRYNAVNWLAAISGGLALAALLLSPNRPLPRPQPEVHS